MVPTGAQTRAQLSLAVRYCVERQHSQGQWFSLPDPRLFDTALVAYSLSFASDARSRRAVDRSKTWIRTATPQSHDKLAKLLEEFPQKLLLGDRRPIELKDPDFYEGVFVRKTLLLYALALQAGLTVHSPFRAEDVRDQVSQYYLNHERIKLKQSNRVDLLSVYILLEVVHRNIGGAIEAAQVLTSLQAQDGSFCYNPVSTAIAFVALSLTMPDSDAAARCRSHLQESQQPDGTWRFCISDIWDTTMMVRSLRSHPSFRIQALRMAVEFLRSSQNPDGGWGFRSGLESDNDTTACALLALQGLRGTRQEVRRGIAHLLKQQTPDGLWRTWQSGGDPPVEDTVAHVVTALQRCSGRHADLRRARQWLVDRYHQNGLWMAGWYRNVPYASLEVGTALGIRHPAASASARGLLELQNADGGWSGVPGAASTPSATGLALTVLLRYLRPGERVVRSGLRFLLEAQNSEGTWGGEPELFGPRPLLYHLPSNSHAFATGGLLAAMQHNELRYDVSMESELWDKRPLVTAVRWPSPAKGLFRDP